MPMLMKKLVGRGVKKSGVAREDVFITTKLWPTDTFVKANDFTGKTVIPFCTSYSSGIGQSDKLLKNEAKGGDWKTGQRFYQDVDLSEVDKWIGIIKLGK